MFSFLQAHRVTGLESPFLRLALCALGCRRKAKLPLLGCRSACCAPLAHGANQLDLGRDLALVPLTLTSPGPVAAPPRRRRSEDTGWSPRASRGCVAWPLCVCPGPCACPFRACCNGQSILLFWAHTWLRKGQRTLAELEQSPNLTCVCGEHKRAFTSEFRFCRVARWLLCLTCKSHSTQTLAGGWARQLCATARQRARRQVER